MPFEINIPTLTGEITSANIVEVGGVSPPNIISASQDFVVNAEWQLCGWLAEFLEGNWRVSLLLESMGPGDEYKLPDPDGEAVLLDSGVPCPADPTCTCYEAHITVGAGVVSPGVYRATLSLTYESNAGVPGPMAGFAEIGLVQVYA